MVQKDVMTKHLTKNEAVLALYKMANKLPHSYTAGEDEAYRDYFRSVAQTLEECSLPELCTFTFDNSVFSSLSLHANGKDVPLFEIFLDTFYSPETYGNCLPYCRGHFREFKGALKASLILLE